jgi:aspartate oxidase
MNPEEPGSRSMREVALLIARCALARKESRGAHFRADYPLRSPEFESHSVVRKGAEIAFWPVSRVRMKSQKQ